MNTYIGFRMDGGFVDENEKSMDRSELIKRIVAIKEQNRKLTTALNFYAKESNWFTGERGAYIDKKDTTTSADVDYAECVGGKCARQTLRELKCNTID